MSRRLGATAALVVGAATLALAIAVAVSEFPRGLGLLGCVLVAGGAAWYGVLRRGLARVAGLTVAALALGGAVALLLAGGSRVAELLVLAGLLVALAAARATLAVHVDLPSASAPRRPVLFFNPRSGGGEGGTLLARGRSTRTRDRPDRAQREARPPLDRPGRACPPLGRRGIGLQQPLPAWPGRRLRNTAAHRRRPARGDGRRRAQRARRGRSGAAAPMAGVVGADLRGRRRSARAGRDRRRGARARSAAVLPHSAASAARACRAQAPGRLAVGDGSRRRVGGCARAGAHRPRA